MFASQKNGLAAYRNVGVETLIASASPHELILMLFDGAISATASGRAHMAQKNTAQKGESISKAIDIITNGLKNSLDMTAGGELSERLAALYDYMTNRLIYANIRNDEKALEEVGNLLSDLRDAWATIGDAQKEAPAS